ncbi:MAG: plasmid stabilization protein [Ahrensia sp.]|nr:plasmid stabilization protein [Ahrensia sp.]
MSDLLIRNIPDHLKDDISRRAKETGRSLSDEVKELLRKGLLADLEKQPPAGETAYDAIRRAFAGVSLSDEEHGDLIRSVEEGREDMGRPVPDPR